MDKVVDHLFVFRGNSIIDDFPGNYSDFRIYEDSKPVEKKVISEKTNQAKNDWISKKSKVKLNYQEQKEYLKLEKEISKLEQEKEILEEKFATENWEGAEIDTQSKNLQELINQLETKTDRWLELSIKLE